MDPGSTKNRDGREVSITQNVPLSSRNVSSAKVRTITFSLGRMGNPLKTSGRLGEMLVLLPVSRSCCFTISEEQPLVISAELELLMV